MTPPRTLIREPAALTAPSLQSLAHEYLLETNASYRSLAAINNHFSVLNRLWAAPRSDTEVSGGFILMLFDSLQHADGFFYRVNCSHMSTLPSPHLTTITFLTFSHFLSSLGRKQMWILIFLCTVAFHLMWCLCESHPVGYVFYL